MSKQGSLVFVSSNVALAVALAWAPGCSGSSGNGDLVGDGGSVLGGGLGGGLGGSTSSGGATATTPKTDAGTPSGNTGSTGGTASSDVCKLQTANPACGQCIETSCCTQMKACAADAPCVALDGCLNTCGPEDEACVKACVQKTPNGVTPWKAMFDCAQTACATECQ
jgi:hypothetical protein